MQHENQNVKGEITVRRRLKELLQSPPSFLWKSSLSTQQLIRVDSDPVVSSTDHVRQWKHPDTSRHIPTFHGGQSCPNPVAEAHPVNEKTPKADAAVVVRGIGIIPVRIPINQVAAQNDRSRFSTMRHPWFLNIFEPCQRWQLTEFRCLYSASWCVWALQLRATNATRTRRYQKVNFQGRNQI